MSYMNTKGMWQETEGCKELGTIIGPGEDKNRNMTSMSETRIKLSCNGLHQGCPKFAKCQK